MAAKTLNPALKALLEFGPILGFIVTYLILRNGTYLIGGTNYSGFVVVIAAFIPIFLIAFAAQWYLTGRVARLQVATALLVLVFGGLSVWLNDARVFKMKPTAIYLLLAVILSIGLARGQSWPKYILEDMIPLKRKGWMLLTKRVTLVFYVSAAANELVWRTQSDDVWLVFETLVMPVLILIFFAAQIGLVIDYATFGGPRKKR